MSGASVSLRPALNGPEFSQSATILLTGGSRVPLNHAAYEFSRLINPGYVWLEVRAPDEPVNWREPSARGLIPESQLLTTSRPQDLAPENTEVDMALWKVIRRGETPSDLGLLVDFMRLPSMVQALFPEITSSADKRPAVFAVVNGDRVLEFYPVSLSSTRALIDVFKRERITLVFAALATGRPDRFAFDYVFRIVTDSKANWMTSHAVCEQAPHGSALQDGSLYELFDRQFTEPERPF